MNVDEQSCPNCRKEGTLHVQCGGTLYCRDCCMFFSKESVESLGKVPVLSGYDEEVP